MLWLILSTALAGTPLVLPGAGATPTWAGRDPGGGWLALVAQDGAYHLVPVNVRVDVETEEYEGATYTWSTAAIDPAVPADLLVRQVDGVGPGSVATTAGPQELAPGTRLDLMGGETLASYGAELPYSEAPGFCPYPYQVVIEAPGTRQTLFAGCSWNGAGSVQWAGDLDHDGRADLAAWMPSPDGLTELQLWLSSAAAPGEAVGRVATWEEDPGC